MCQLVANQINQGVIYRGERPGDELGARCARCNMLAGLSSALIYGENVFEHGPGMFDIRRLLELCFLCAAQCPQVT